MHARASVLTAVALQLVAGVSATEAVTEQIVGTWTFVSSDQVRPDGH
jgi:hypothetical protein